VAHKGPIKAKPILTKIKTILDVVTQMILPEKHLKRIWKILYSFRSREKD